VWPARLLNIGTLNGRRGTYQIRAVLEGGEATIFNNTVVPRNQDMIVLWHWWPIGARGRRTRR